MQDVLQRVTESFDGLSPYEINDGNCEHWANEVMEALADSPHAVELWETPFGRADTTHTFLRIDGKFYDAECHEGVEDHTDLPLFQKLFAATGRRQPVWLLDYYSPAGSYEPTESHRDMSDKLLAECRSDPW